MKTPLERIQDAVRPHVGPENAISAPELARKVKMPERTVRSLIAGSPGFQPCGKAGAGYFWPSDIVQIHAVDDRLAKQEAAIRQRRKVFRTFWKKQGIAFPKS